MRPEMGHCRRHPRQLWRTKLTWRGELRRSGNGKGNTVIVIGIKNAMCESNALL